METPETLGTPETLMTLGDKTYDTTLYFAKEYEDAIIPTKNHHEDAGYDVYAYEDCYIPAKGHGYVKTGIRIMTQAGWRWHFAPRSGLGYVKRIQAYHGSIMDPYFCGDTTALVFNNSDVDYYIKKGDRFCQVIVSPIPQTFVKEVSLDEMKQLAEGKRGEKRWGSSGT